MKIRKAVSLVGLVIGFVLPGLAQEQKTVDPEVRQEIDAATKKREDAFNKHDAAALSALYTEDAIDVWPSYGGATVGLPAIVKRYETFLASNPRPHSFEVTQVYAMANKICAVVDYTDHHSSKGQALVVYVLEPDGWKVRLFYLLN
jgi:ketosteroid isomerase-like protein